MRNFWLCLIFEYPTLKVRRRPWETFVAEKVWLCAITASWKTSCIFFNPAINQKKMRLVGIPVGTAFRCLWCCFSYKSTLKYGAEAYDVTASLWVMWVTNRLSDGSHVSCHHGSRKVTHCNHRCSCVGDVPVCDPRTLYLCLKIKEIEYVRDNA